MVHYRDLDATTQEAVTAFARHKQQKAIGVEGAAADTVERLSELQEMITDDHALVQAAITHHKRQQGIVPVYDYIIVGDGLAGTSMVWELLQKGVPGDKILVLEKSPFDLVEGSSKGEARIGGRLTGSESDVYAQTAQRGWHLLKGAETHLHDYFARRDLNVVAQRWTQQFERPVTGDILTEADIISIGNDASGIHDTHASAKSYGASLEFIQQEPNKVAAYRMIPGKHITPAEDESVIIEHSNQKKEVGLLNPAKLIQSVRQYAQDQGVTYQYRANVQSFADNAQGVHVTYQVNEDDVFTAHGKDLVIANGADAPKLIPTLDGFIEEQPIHLFHYAMPVNGNGEALVKDSVLMRDQEKDIGVFFMPDVLNGEPVVKAGIHNVEAFLKSIELKKKANKDKSDVDFFAEEIASTLQRLYGRDFSEVNDGRITCNYVLTPDHQPIVGQWRDASKVLHPHVFMYTGGNGTMAKHVLSISEALVAKMRGVRAEEAVDIATFSPDRLGTQVRAFEPEKPKRVNTR